MESQVQSWLIRLFENLGKDGGLIGVLFSKTGELIILGDDSSGRPPVSVPCVYRSVKNG